MVTPLIGRADQQRIAAAIAAAEAGTSAEIFCVAARRVSAYRDVALGWAAAAALLAPMGLIPLGFDPAWFPGVGDSWEGAHLASRDIVIGRALSAYAVLQAAVFVTVFLAVSTARGRRWATPRSVRRMRVRHAAVRQFQAHGLHQTQGRTGVLVFAAHEDRQAEIVVDQGLVESVPPEVWGAIAAELARALGEGRWAEGLEAAVMACGQVLSAHAPAGPDDRNELPDRLILL